MQKNYGGVIWTNHALTRLRERGIKQGDAWATWKRPDSSEFNSGKGAWVYQKTFGSKNIEVVAKKNDVGEWIMLSVWDKGLGQTKRISGQTFLKKILKSLGLS